MNLSNDIENTLKSTELDDITMDLCEVFLDEFQENGILKEIPIIRTILGISNGIASISDRLFAKKLFLFIYELKDLSVIERNMQMINIQRSLKYQSEIGEKILMVIDKVNDSKKATWNGKLFYHCLKREVDYDQFLRCSEVINNASVSELIDVINGEYTGIPIDQEDNLISSGLFKIIPPQIELKKIENTIQHYRDGEDLKTDYKLTEMEWTAVLTKSGQLIRKFLKNS